MKNSKYSAHYYKDNFFFRELSPSMVGVCKSVECFISISGISGNLREHPPAGCLIRLLTDRAPLKLVELKQSKR